ncbi:hypothetical protein RB195_022424 [Necator americanus]|uniref:Glucuronosyltransferase n=1 Tax=Necator americanus TaxID=51031 RepID=A0ABR1EG84_NECAM
MATKLALPGMGHELCTMSGIGGHIEKFNSKNVQLKILTAFGDEVNLQIQTKPIITNGFPSVELTKEDKQFLQYKDLYICNPKLLIQNQEIQNLHILVGLDHYYDFILNSCHAVQLPSRLHSSKTIFGPAIHGRGRDPQFAHDQTSMTYGLMSVNERSEAEILHKMFELEGKFHGLQFGVPEMPSLPPDRVVITKAFQNVGCDLIGPFESKMDEGMYRNLKSSIPVVAIDRDHDKDFDSNLIQSVSQAKEALEFSERISNRQPRHGKNMNLKIREIVLVEQEQPNQASKKRAYEVIQRFEQSLE